MFKKKKREHEEFPEHPEVYNASNIMAKYLDKQLPEDWMFHLSVFRYTDNGETLQVYHMSNATKEDSVDVMEQFLQVYLESKKKAN